MQHSRRNIPKRLFSTLILLVCLTVLTPGIPRHLNTSLAAPESSLQVSFIDVGQGDSALIHDSSNFDILIDGGIASAGPTVAAYIKQQGIDDIDVMVASHPDSDHIGGLISVLDDPAIPVEAVYYNGYPGNTVTWSNFVAAVSNKGLTLTVAQFPQELTWGETTAYVLNPISGLGNPDPNDASLVILIVHGIKRFLFTGDIDEGVETAILARSTPVAADILKVAHHGSAYGSSSTFLAAVNPKEALISVGENPYGHPAPETIDRLNAVGAQVWRTDLNGTVVVWSDGTTYTIAGSIVPPEPVLFLPLIMRISPAGEDIRITDILFNGTGSAEPDEFVAIRNFGSSAVQLQQWTLRDNADHVYTFPGYSIQPGQECRIYTNQYNPEYCGFNYGSGSAIWNNAGDCAYLKDSLGNPVDTYCYP